jgi:gamma-glutamylcyclotransferase (GGCT)/AIG2-like uncharacterized protein YtfP
MTHDRHLIFVYGTLRHLDAAHDLLAGCEHVGRAKTIPKFSLRNMGPYPAMVPTGEQRVVGELYWVPSDRIAVLDAYEDHPTLYQRTQIKLDHPDHPVAEAYLMTSSVALGYPLVPSGDWHRMQDAA